MTAGDLMVLFSKIARDARVKAWDPDSEEYEEVTGIVWDDDGTHVIIQTDDPS